MRPWALGVIAASHGTLALTGLLPGSGLLGPALTRLPSSAGRAVALTFDDGPDPEVTPRVLDLLDGAGARASFFCIGRAARRHPELVADITARGHEVENHTDEHPPAFAAYLPAAAGRQIDRAQETLTELTGRPPGYFRAPAGVRNPYTELLLARRGLTLAAWSGRGFDTVDGNPGRVCRRLLPRLEAGAVLLLHDGNAARTGAGEAVVLEVLPRLLEAMRDQGLAGVPLPPLPPLLAPAGGGSDR